VNAPPKILFTATFSTPFIQTDLAILQRYFSVTPIIDSGLSALRRYVMHIGRSTHTVTWFASTYSAFIVFMAHRMNKKSFIILGGVDVAKVPELNYGIWVSRWRSMLVRYALRNADRVLAVDESLKQDAMTLVPYDGANIVVIPTGYDDTYWTPDGDKEQIVLTVAHCSTITRARIKGIDFLITIARTLPDVRFIVVGIHSNLLNDFHFPSNVQVIAYVGPERLREYYRRATVYLQPSLREGLPNTLCEAMLCECVPVGTRTGGIPTAIGDTGTVISFGDINDASRAVTKALSEGRSREARHRIRNHFTLQRREEQLVALFRG
jgi:glycosyltransferase involved in cell wall biosynthesis